MISHNTAVLEPKLSQQNHVQIIFESMHKLEKLNKRPLAVREDSKCLFTPTAWRAILTRKLGQTDLVFTVPSGFIS